MTNTLKKQSFDYELIAMSYHEAGHVVSGLHNYIHVFNAKVMTPKNLDGNTEYYLYESESIKDEELKKIVLVLELQSLYGGLIAEKMYYKDICGSSKFPMHLRIGSSYDMALASAIIRKNDLAVPGKRTVLFKKQVQNDVEQLLSEHWDAVKVIAHSLYRKKRLTFDKLKYLLTRKTDHQDFWRDRFKKIRLINNENNPPAENFVKEIMLENAIFSI